MKIFRWGVAWLLGAFSSAGLAQLMPGMTMPQDTPVTHQRRAGKSAAIPSPAVPTPAQNVAPMPGMTVSPTGAEAGAPAGRSITRDQSMQEPETPARRTGSREPAPELLTEVALRKPMTLEDFLKLAEAANPTLAQARSRVEQTAAEARQADLYPNPSVGYQGDQIRGGRYGGGEQGGYVQQTIVLGGKLGLRKDIYTRQRLADETGVEEQSYRVTNDVSQAFYDALTAQAMVVLRQRTVGVALDAVETVHQLANVGQADAPDVLQAEVEAEQAKIAFVNAQRTYLGRFSALAAMCGAATLPASPLEGMLERPPDFDPAPQLRALVETSPSIRKMRQQVEVAQARLNDARREWVPDLDLKAGEQYSFEQLGGAAGARAAGPQTFASAGIGLPLWNRNQGKVAAAQALIERTRADVTREQLLLQARATPIAQSYLAARYAAERYRTQIIPRAQRAYELYLTKYQQMAMAYPQVLVSQRTLVQVQTEYLSALRQVWSDAIALRNFALSGALSEADRGSGGTPDTTQGAPE